MNYRTMVKGALALSLSLIVGTSWAGISTTNDVPQYGVTFETTVSTTVPLNDRPYVAETLIGTNNTTVSGDSFGWFAGSSDDESKVIEGGPTGSTQALQLNTDSATLTNKLAAADKTAVNNAIAANGAYIETEVKFVASDTDSAGIEGGTDATKFAIYAYNNEDAPRPEGVPATTNLVVYHAYQDYTDESLSENNYIGYTNEVFATLIDTEKYTKLRVEMKKVHDEGADKDRTVFSVAVDGGEPLSSTTAFSDNIWFLTVEDPGNDTVAEVASLNFKGTGEIDNISVGVIDITTKVATVDGTDYATWADALAAIQNGSVVTAYEDGTIDLASGTITLNKNGFNVTVTTSTQGKKIQDNGDGTYTVVDDIRAAMVITVAENVPTTNVFPTISEAFAFAGTNGVSPATVALLQSAALETRLEVGAGTNIVFDLNGYTLTREGDAIKNCGTLMITNGTITATGNVVYNAAPGASLTVNAGTYTSTQDIAFAIYGAANTTIIVHGGTITAQEACIGAYSRCGGHSTIIVDGGTLTSIDNAVIMTNGTNGDGGNTIAVTGGTLNGGIQTAGYIACGIYLANADTLTFGGDAVINVTGGAGIVVRAGEATVGVNGGSITTTGSATGKVGDANVALPCAAIVYDTSAKYPGLDTATAGLEITGGTFISAVSPCVQQIMAEGDEEIVTIPALVNGQPNSARFSDASADGVPEGYELVEDAEHPGLYKIQAITPAATVISVAKLSATGAMVNDAAPTLTATVTDENGDAVAAADYTIDASAIDMTTAGLYPVIITATGAGYAGTLTNYYAVMNLTWFNGTPTQKAMVTNSYIGLHGKEGSHWMSKSENERFLAINHCAGDAGTGCRVLSLYEIATLTNLYGVCYSHWEFAQSPLTSGCKGVAVSEAAGLVTLGNVDYSPTVDSTYAIGDVSNKEFGTNLSYAFMRDGAAETRKQDSPSFSTDGNYIYVNTYNPSASRNLIGKYSVDKANNQFVWVQDYVGSVSRIRSLEVYAIDGRDYVFYGDGAGNQNGDIYAMDTVTGVSTLVCSASESAVFANDGNSEVQLVRISGITSGEMYLYAHSDLGTIVVWALRHDVATGAWKTALVREFTQAEYLALCNLGSLGNSRNLEVSDDNQYGFILPHSTKDARLIIVSDISLAQRKALASATLTPAGSDKDVALGAITATVLDENGATVAASEYTITTNLIDIATVGEYTVTITPVEGSVYSNAVTAVYTISEAAAGYNYPEGGAIEDAAVVAWLTAKGFTQAQVTALGTNAKLNECYLLNCDISQAGAGGAIAITAITVDAQGVHVTVALTRTAGIAGGINGTLKLYGADDLADEFEELDAATVTDDDFSEGDTTTATLSGGTAKFFRAVVE